MGQENIKGIAIIVVVALFLPGLFFFSQILNFLVLLAIAIVFVLIIIGIIYIIFSRGEGD